MTIGRDGAFNDRTTMILRMRERLSDESGLGLVEVMVAIALMTVLLTSAALTLTKQMTMQRDSKAREGALDIAAQAIDSARGSKDFSALNAATWTDTMNRETYTITRSVTTYLQNSSGSPCDGCGSSSVAYKQIGVAVSWSGMANPTAPVRSQTLLSPNVTSYDPTLGNLAVKVKNAGGAGVEGALVTTTGPSGTRTTYSDAAGCAFVEQLTPGTYTATVALSGYVTPTGQTTTSKTLTVQAAQTVAAAFELAVTSTLTISLPKAEYVPNASVPLTLGNTSLVPNGRLSVSGTGSPRVMTGRYPYQSGYTVWGGTCDDADPEGGVAADITAASMPAGSPYLSVMDATNAGKYHPGASRGSAITALPVPSTNSGTVDMADLQVTVTSTSRKAVAGLTVTMTHIPWDPATSATAFPGCANGESYVLGTTDAAGQLKADTPWGYWSFTTSAAGSTPLQLWLHPTSNIIAVAVTVP